MTRNIRKLVSDSLKKDYTKLLTVVAANIKVLRENNKLTQEEMEEKIDYTTRFIQKLESGNYAPNLLTLTRIARFFGVSVSKLLEE